MKRILSIILALTMVLCLGLTACNNKSTDNENNDNNVDTGLVEYYENFEKTMEEYQEKDELDKEILANVAGLPISAAAVRYTTLLLKAPGQLSEEEITTEIETFYKQNAALVKVAFENGVELSESNLNEIEANIATMQMQLGDQYEEEFAKQPFTKFFYYFQTGVYQSLYNNLYEKLLADKESELTKSVFEEAKTDMVRAKHILIQFPAGEGENGELTDEQKEATLNKANEALDKVNAMADISEFDALIEEYNDDPGMQSFPDGYHFKKGEMVQAFEEAAYSLEDGETSGLVETPYGYHILLKLPIESDEGVYTSNTFAALFNEKLYDSITKVSEELVIEYGENHDARVEDFIKEYNDSLAEAESEVEPEVEVEAEAETEDQSEEAAE